MLGSAFFNKMLKKRWKKKREEVSMKLGIIVRFNHDAANFRQDDSLINYNVNSKLD